MHRTAMALIVGLTLSTGCMRVAETRTTPILELAPVETRADGSVSWREVEVGHTVERVQRTRFSWKKALLIGLIVPMVATTSLAAGLE